MFGVRDGLPTFGEYGGIVLTTGEGEPITDFNDGELGIFEGYTDGEGTLLDGLFDLFWDGEGDSLPNVNGDPINDEPIFETAPFEYDENTSGISLGLFSYRALIFHNVSVLTFGTSPTCSL